MGKEREGPGKVWAIGSKGAKDGWETAEEKMPKMMERGQRVWVRARMGEELNSTRFALQIRSGGEGGNNKQAAYRTRR